MGEKPKLSAVPTGIPPAATASPPPATLGEAGADLWRRVMAEYRIDDVGGREMLAQACAACDRAAALAALIERDGAVIYSKSGPRSHPAIKDEIACRGFIVRTLHRLGLDVEPIRAVVGRPGLGVGWKP
jgi:hypothetical protein